MVVARDIAHAKLRNAPTPATVSQYLKDYCGTTRRPSHRRVRVRLFGPARGMDSYVEQFQANGGSYVMLAGTVRSGDRPPGPRWLHLGSIGGPAARLALDCIRHVEVLESELGMEAVWRSRSRTSPPSSSSTTRATTSSRPSPSPSPCRSTASGGVHRMSPGLVTEKGE
jgi:fumarate hydratase class I